MLSILLIIDVEACSDTFVDSLFIKNITKNIADNKLIILTKNSIPLNHTIEKILKIHSCRNSNNCHEVGITRRAIAKMASYFESSVDVDTALLPSYEGYVSTINALNNDKDKYYTISINKDKKRNKTIINLPTEILTNKEKDFIKLNKNEICNWYTMSAFNYHLQIIQEGDVYKFKNMDDTKKDYSTGLWEFIIQYSKKFQTIKGFTITVCGEIESITELYTIIFGIIYYELYKDQIPQYTVKFVYDISHLDKFEETILYEHINKLISALNMSDKLQISFTIKYKMLLYEYEYKYGQYEKATDINEIIHTMNENEKERNTNLRKKLGRNMIVQEKSNEKINRHPWNHSIVMPSSRYNNNYNKYIKYKSKYLNISSV